MLLGFSAASLTLPAVDSEDPSAATLYQRALERQVLYNDLDTEAARKGLLLGHEIMSTTTQSQVFDRISNPGHWKKPTVKAILHSLEVGRQGGHTARVVVYTGLGLWAGRVAAAKCKGAAAVLICRDSIAAVGLVPAQPLSQHARWPAHVWHSSRLVTGVAACCVRRAACCCLLLPAAPHQVCGDALP